MRVRGAGALDCFIAYVPTLGVLFVPDPVLVCRASVSRSLLVRATESLPEHPQTRALARACVLVFACLSRVRVAASGARGAALVRRGRSGGASKTDPVRTGIR